MGREVRRVPADWQHPRDRDGHYQPLHDQDFGTAAKEWKDGYLKWYQGLKADFNGVWKPRDADDDYEFWEYDSPPDRQYRRPAWPEESRTHYQIYETVTEGTPISPPCATLEELARWYADNGDPVYGRTLSYEQALAFVRAGSAPSMVIDHGRLVGGPEFVADSAKPL